MNVSDHSLERPLALLASLPAGDAAALLERLPTTCIQRLIAALPSAPHVACRLPEELVASLAAESKPQNEMKSYDGDWDRLQLAPEQVLMSADASSLATMLAGELPQTVAVVLRRLPVETAAQVLARLSSRAQLAVARCMALQTLGDPMAQAQVCQSVAAKVVASAARPLQPSSGVVMVARVLDRLDRATERALLENLAQEDPLICARVRLVRTLLARLRATRFVAERQAA